MSLSHSLSRTRVLIGLLAASLIGTPALAQPTTGTNDVPPDLEIVSIPGFEKTPPDAEPVTIPGFGSEQPGGVEGPGPETQILRIDADGGPATVVRFATSKPQPQPHGTSLVNGMFVHGLHGWHVADSGSERGGDVIVTDRQALFVEGVGTVQILKQTVGVPAHAEELSFELFLDPGFATDDPAGADAFECHILDAYNRPAAASWHPQASSIFCMQEDGRFFLAPGTTYDGERVTFDATRLTPGEQITLVFAQIGADTDEGESVRVDTVKLGRGSIPVRPLTAVKGSLLIFPKVEVRWDVDMNLVRDTFLSLTNDFGEPVRITTYYVTEQCAHIDQHFDLTREQTAYWSVATGQPGPGGANLLPLTVAAAPLQDTSGGDYYLQGYVLAIAVDANGHQIRWNKLMGDATIVDYRSGAAGRYHAYAFTGHGVMNGAQIGAVAGEILLDEAAPVGYASAFERLLLSYFCNGVILPNSTPTAAVVGETDLTLMMLEIDLRRNSLGPWNTYVQYEIWDENETMYTGLGYCMPKWQSLSLSNIGATLADLPTDRGYARIWSSANEDCDVYYDDGNWWNPPVLVEDSIPTSLLGVYLRDIHYVIPGRGALGMDMVAGTLRGSGLYTPGPMIRWDVDGGGDDKAQPPTEFGETDSDPAPRGDGAQPLRR